MYEACTEAMRALHACKRALGLQPNQCYPGKGYGGECDRSEAEFKRCLAYVADPRDAKVLYDSSATRDARVQANLRLQKKLRRFNVPCTP